MHTSMQGMTLVEIMIVIALIGVGMTVATPSFNAMIARNQAATQINELVTSINLARSEASKISGTVSIQATTPGVNFDFMDGWCVVVGNPGNCTGTTAEPVIRHSPPILGATSLRSESATLQFNAYRALNSEVANRTFSFCGPVKSRLITVSLVGRVSLSDGVVCP